MVVGDDRPEITQFPVGSGQFPGEQPFLADDNSSGLNPPTSRNVNVVASAELIQPMSPCRSCFLRTIVIAEVRQRFPRIDPLPRP
jgi:hypothetical protein